MEDRRSVGAKFTGIVAALEEVALMVANQSAAS